MAWGIIEQEMMHFHTKSLDVLDGAVLPDHEPLPRAHVSGKLDEDAAAKQQQQHKLSQGARETLDPAAQETWGGSSLGISMTRQSAPKQRHASSSSDVHVSPPVQPVCPASIASRTLLEAAESDRRAERGHAADDEIKRCKRA